MFNSMTLMIMKSHKHSTTILILIFKDVCFMSYHFKDLTHITTVVQIYIKIKHSTLYETNVHCTKRKYLKLDTDFKTNNLNIWNKNCFNIYE